jgi:3-phenylpropionate/trans-cinnamate dioxygenase ferredoxin reductase subunit
MDAYRYVIVGGGLAGGKACEGIRQVDEAGSVALVTQEPRRPYHRPPLSKDYLQGEMEAKGVYLEDAAYYEDHDIDLITGRRAVALNPAERTVTLDDESTLAYETMLLATGGHARRLSIPGSDLPDVFTLRTLEDSRHIRKAATSGKDALVLGGSFIGSEVAASLTLRDVRVTMVFPEQRLLERLVPPSMSEFLQEIYASHKIEILTGITPERLFGASRVQGVQLSNGVELAVDLVVMGVGIDLNTDLAQEAGLETRSSDTAVIVDETLRTSDPHIYAAGDIAAWPGHTFDKRMRVEHWDVARTQGLRVGQNMAGEVEPYTTLPYYFSDLFDLSFEVWGDLADWDRTVLRGSLDARSFTFFYFDEADKMVGVLTMGRPEEEREPMQNLVKARVDYARVASGLKDESVDLATFVS